MNGVARETTSLKSSGTSKAWGAGFRFCAARMRLLWRASTVRMLPAAVRVRSSAMLAAAPRYAVTPTPSSIPETSTNSSAVVTGKEYVHGLTAGIPAAARASCKNLTCVFSSDATPCSTGKRVGGKEEKAAALEKFFRP